MNTTIIFIYSYTVSRVHSRTEANASTLSFTVGQRDNQSEHRMKMYAHTLA